jgi:putative addiction module component (TIGR02574 family)
MPNFTKSFFMASVDMVKLLSLPQKQRKKIAEELWDSLTPSVKDDQKVIELLEKRWKNIQSGKSKIISSETFWKNMESHLQQKHK